LSRRLLVIDRQGLILATFCQIRQDIGLHYDFPGDIRRGSDLFLETPAMRRDDGSAGAKNLRKEEGT
jgi:hypothetical protein